MKPIPLYTIEHGIPIPEPDDRPHFHRRAIARQMDIDDSVLVESKDAARAIIRAFRDLDIKGTIRRAEGGYRVWRTK